MPNVNEKRAWELRARGYCRSLALELRKLGFRTSPAHFNPGGPAVWGECSFYAIKDSHTVRVEALRLWSSLPCPEDAVMYRAEDWPEHLGGLRGHKRTGPNRYARVPFRASLLAATIEDSAFFDASRMI